MIVQRKLPISTLDIVTSPRLQTAMALELIVMHASKAAQAALAAEVIVIKALAVAALAGMASHEANSTE